MACDFKRQINVCHVVFTLEVGGMEKVVIKLCESIDRNIIKPSVICLDRVGVLGAELIKRGIRVDFIKRKSGLDLSLIKKMRDYFNENSIDIIHSHSGCMFYSTLAGRLSNVKAIIHTDHGRHYPERKMVVLEECIASFFINKIVAVSDDLKDYLYRKLHFPKKKIECIANGVDTEQFFSSAWRERVDIIKSQIGINNNEYIIGTIGRLSGVKNQTLLIRAFNQVLKVHNKSKLLIVGIGPELENLKKLTKDLNILNKVFFLGVRKDIPQVISVFDLFVLPSFSEGTSITLLEALSSGVPVIASNVGGNPEIVLDGNTGLLFNNNDVEDLTNKICKLMSDPQMANTFARMGRQHVVNNYSVNTMNKKYISLYRRYVC